MRDLAAWSSALAVLLETTPPEIADARGWWTDFQASRVDDPFCSAVIGGGRADRMAWAFAAGYQSAIAALIESHDAAKVGAMCVTENGPPHPRNVKASWDGTHLSGHKRYVTLGAHAEVLYVLAKQREPEAAEGRVKLRLLRVAADASGITLLPGAPTSFVPEVPHADVRFDSTPATALPGDGWSDWVKPFRTVEDLYVNAAVAAHAAGRLAHSGAPRGPIERGLGTLYSLRLLAWSDPADPLTHLALQSGLDSVRELFEALLRAPLPADERTRLERDHRLLAVASSARAARRDGAWTRLSSGV